MYEKTQSPYVKNFDWLQNRLADDNLKIIDASWFLPAQNRKARDEYDKAHIPGAVFFDQDVIVDASSDLPHALPSPEIFSNAVGALGISDQDAIIIYDAIGMFTAPRVWWMFKIMGAQNVFVLNGGFDQWRSEGYPVTDQRLAIQPSTFKCDFESSQIANIKDVKAALSDDHIQILDARSAGRFSGQEAEPRPGMRSGHMPGAINLPFQTLSHGGQLKSLAELTEIFDHHKVDLSKPIITSCGSGVTAAVLILALQSLGHKDNQIYDGSWSEWGAKADTPIVGSD